MKSLQDIEQKLARIEDDDLTLAGQVWGVFREEAASLTEHNPVEAVRALDDWIASHPSATMLLFLAIENISGLPARLTPLLLRLPKYIPLAPLVRESVEDVLRRALEDLSPALRSVAFEQYPALLSPGSKAGQGNARQPVSEVEPWPDDRNFPPLNTIEGRQARLRYLGYPTGDTPGTWGVQSQAALIRYQIASKLPILGEWDEQTASSLDDESFAKMCEHRDDPSTLLDE